MTLADAIENLRAREDWDTVVAHVRAELNSAMLDFQTPDLLDNPQKLARLAGEIAAFDRLVRIFSNATPD
tara:strand:- start:866 stop:1075 length:210 start_codon:yes stop_codon:yes gene_type:complete